MAPPAMSAYYEIWQMLLSANETPKTLPDKRYSTVMQDVYLDDTTRVRVQRIDIGRPNN
jgi:hypothetical protein